MQLYSITPREMVASFWRNRSLILTLTTREVLGKYRGSIMGILWSFLLPLLMLGVYTFVFSVVFKARWSSTSESKTEFALILFAGLLVYNLFAECLIRAPGLILANANYVKKVVFPLEILPWVAMCSALFHTFISFCAWIIIYLVIFGLPHLTVLYFPIVLIPTVLMIMGLSWFLASSGVYLRDIGQLIGVIVSTLMFLTPIFYPASALPQDFAALFYANPLTPVVEQAREVLIWGRQPDWMVLGYSTCLSSIIAMLGFAWFQKTRRGFADVI